MHIIAGSLRRRRLHVPKGLRTRPTTGRVREAVFSMLESRRPLVGTSVLDLFAGTGSLGLEAISRGARSVLFVERRADVLSIARRNAVNLGVDDQCRFRCSDAIAFVSRYCGPPYDVVFADPPYDFDGLSLLLDHVMVYLAPGGYIVLEHDRRVSFASHPRIDTTRSFGSTVVSVFSQPDQTAPHDGT